MHKTIIMVTHDPYFASLSQKVVLLKDGKILDTLLRQDLGDSFHQKVFEYTTSPFSSAGRYQIVNQETKIYARFFFNFLCRCRQSVWFFLRHGQ